MIRISTTLIKLFVACGIFCYSLTGCQQEIDEANYGQGKFMLDLRTDVTFKETTKSIDQSLYQNINNYTVQLLKGVNVVKTFVYGDMPLLNDLDAGSYTIKAYYGDNVGAGYDKLYVEGSQDFTLANAETKQIGFTCVPANVKVNVMYTDDFSTYFNDCAVDFKTSSLTTAFRMNMSDFSKDLYLKAGKTSENLNLSIILTDKLGNLLTPVTAQLSIKARDFLTITLKPNVTDVVGGAISGITITVNSNTVDEDINITIPDEYLPE
ncbi:MAG: DUF4493 domain-containing protein [Bacteroidales bacterium]|nr:DUF4493 domain-containing protein [Bacteroidales bacterium]